jgi:hypothetical protein
MASTSNSLINRVNEARVRFAQVQIKQASNEVYQIDDNILIFYNEICSHTCILPSDPRPQYTRPPSKSD